MFRGELPTGNWREASAESSSTLRAEIIDYVTHNPGSGLRKLREIKKELERLDKLSRDPVPQLRESDIEKLIERVAPSDITDPSLLNDLIRQEIATKGISIDTFVRADQRATIEYNSPEAINLSDDVSLKLYYKNGKVQARVARLVDVYGLEKETFLPDGRPVQLMYEKKPYTLVELQAMAERKG